MTAFPRLTGPPLQRIVPLEELLRQGCAAPAPRPALISREGSLDWPALERRSARLAARYRELGLRPGERLASLLPNRADGVVHLLACLRAGVVATPLNYRYTPPEIDYALTTSGARLLLFHAERAADVADTPAAADLALGTLVMDGCGGSFEALLEGPGPAGGSDLPQPPAAADAPALIFFTSGSTARPKGVTHTRRSLATVLSSTAQALGFTPDDRFLAGTSLAHVGGATSALAALLAGATLVVSHSSGSEEIRWLLGHSGATVLKLLPAALFSLVRDPALDAGDLRRLRLCVSGGDHIPAELQREFGALAGFPVDELYGMTEVGMVAVSPPGEGLRPGSLGRPCPGVTMALRRSDGGACATGETGDLWIRTGGCMDGYWNNPTATAEVLVDGWLNSGDVMRADEEGYLWFAGRRKQIIVHDSSNICPQDVEDVLLEHPAVAEAGVVGIHDLVHGEDVRAYISLRHPPAADPVGLERELIAFARDRIGYKAPEQIVVLPALPLNGTGKVDRLALKRLAEATPPPT